MKKLALLIVISILVLLSGCVSDSQKNASSPSDSAAPIKDKNEEKVNNAREVIELEETVSSASLSSKVELNSVDYSLLNKRLLEKINAERRKLNLIQFGIKSDLGKAARIHNEHMLKTNVLSHTQVGTTTPNMMDRVKKAGGNYRTVGENIQYEGFTIRTYNGVKSIVTPDYEELAESLWQNWKTSPPHYKNLLAF